MFFGTGMPAGSKLGDPTEPVASSNPTRPPCKSMTKVSSPSTNTDRFASYTNQGTHTGEETRPTVQNQEIRRPNWTDANAVPFYFTILCVSNLVGALVISNPINIIVADWFDIGFVEYALWMAIPAVVSMVVTYLGLAIFFRNVIPPEYSPPAPLPASSEGKRFRVFTATVLVITLLGLSVISKTKVVNATVGWTLFAVWLISLVVLLFTIPKIIYDFRAEGDYEQTEEFSIRAASIHLGLAETGMDDYDFTHLDMKGYDGEDIRLVKEFKAFGSSRRDAIENAQMITYNVEVEDSILWFDSNFKFNPNAKFRFQELDMTLYIPYGQEFTISDDMRHILKYYTISRHGYYYYQMEDNRWVYNPSGLECITCFDSEEKAHERSEELRRSYEESFHVRGYYEELDFADFSNKSV